MTDDKMREAFEEFVCDQTIGGLFSSLKRDADGCYENSHVHTAWRSWQAATRAAVPEVDEEQITDSIECTCGRLHTKKASGWHVTCVDEVDDDALLRAMYPEAPMNDLGNDMEEYIDGVEKLRQAEQAKGLSRIEPIPLNESFKRCSHQEHKPPTMTAACCDHCNDGEGRTVYPYYGVAPHTDDNPWVTAGRAHILPRAQWPTNFREDPDCKGCGTYFRCLECGAGETTDAR